MLVAGFFDWFVIYESGVETCSDGAVPEKAAAPLLRLRHPFALIFGADPERQTGGWSEASLDHRFFLSFLH